MADKLKSDRIKELLPKIIASSGDPNWNGLINAIGEEDDRLAQLIVDVRNQFFVKTASRPYLDRLASNSNLVRPRFVGMTDTDFKTYIPILSYQPKQVKNIVETLLDLFFLKEATTAFLSSTLYSPFILTSGWSIQIKVDNINTENIVFLAADFSNILVATADEVVATYNRQAKYSFATNFYDSVAKQNYIRIFTNTIGTQGSMEIEGGLANIGLQLNGFLSDLGTGSNTQWSITKIGDQVSIMYTGGTLPGIDNLLIGDIFLSNLPGNQGSFVITSVDVEDDSFTYTNLLATAGTVTQTSSDQAKWIRPEKYTAYKLPRRALLWETSVNSTTVEMPVTPTIVKRNLKGGFYINGNTSLASEFNSSTSLTVEDATDFPASGMFVIEPINAITTRLTGGDSDEVVTYNFNGRLISNLIKYSYTSISGNTLLGIIPNLPTLTNLNETNLSSLSKTGGVVTCVVANTFLAGDHAIIRGSSGIPILATTGTTTTASPVITSVADLTGVTPGQLALGVGIPSGAYILSVSAPSTVILSREASASGSVAITFTENTNGNFEIQSANSTSFTFNQLGANGSATTPGVVSLEKIELAEVNSKIIITASQSSNTSLIGPYVWDERAPFVLSAETATITNEIQAGRIVKLLDISSTTFPEGEGFVIFNYGQNNQEGPVKYLYKATNNILVLDPSYTFQQNHDASSSVVALSHKGPHIMSRSGAEYPPYATNPSAARLILQDLISSVASAGIFIDFLIRRPIQLYGTLTVYS